MDIDVIILHITNSYDIVINFTSMKYNILMLQYGKVISLVASFYM